MTASMTTALSATEGSTRRQCRRSQPSAREGTCRLRPGGKGGRYSISGGRDDVTVHSPKTLLRLVLWAQAQQAATLGFWLTDDQRPCQPERTYTHCTWCICGTLISCDPTMRDGARHARTQGTHRCMASWKPEEPEPVLRWKWTWTLTNARMQQTQKQATKAKQNNKNAAAESHPGHDRPILWIRQALAFAAIFKEKYTLKKLFYFQAGSYSQLVWRCCRVISC